MNISFLCIRIHKKQNWPFHRWIRYGFKSGWTICWVGYHSFYNCIWCIQGVQNDFISNQDLPRFISSSQWSWHNKPLILFWGKNVLKKKNLWDFYEKYDENFTKNHNHDAYWKGRGRTVGFNQRTAASLIHLPPCNKSHLWTQLCSCWSQPSDFILYGK